MPAQDVNIEDLARRVTQLEKTLERISERATRREEDWGTVRSKADKVDGLRDEMRELRHLVTRYGSASGEAPAAPGAVVSTAQPTQSVVDAVVAQLKGRAIPTSREDTVALVRQAILEDEKVRQAMVVWLTQELQDRGFVLPQVLQKRAGPRAVR